MDASHARFMPLDSAQAATIAPLSRRERNGAAGEERRRKVATVLGVAGGIGSVLAMKSAATAAAIWLGAPALGVVAVGAVATMAAAGSVGYISNYMAKRRIMKESGFPPLRFSFGDLFKSMFLSKPAILAGSMAGLAAVVPAAGMLVIGSAVAGVGAGVQEYFSKRREAKEAGHPVDPFTFRNMFAEINHSKGAKKAFLISAGLGALISGAVMALTGLSAPHVAPSASGVVTDFNGAATGADTAMPSVEAPAVEASAPTVEAPATSYEIQPKDTLWDIAKQFAGNNASNAQIHDKMHDIAAFNRIEDINHIEAGRTLNLPVTADDFEQVTKIRDEILAAKAQAVVTDATPAPASTPLEIITGADGSETIHYSNGIVETRTPIMPVPSPALEVPAVAPAAVPATAAAVPQLPAAGECLITETDSALKIDCKVGADTVIQPGSGIDFRAAAGGEPFRVGLSAESAPVKAAEFLENFAVPEAREAYFKGGFSPKP